MFRILSGEELKEFLLAEREEISKYKWIRSEEVGYDLGISACLEWIQNYAASFRDVWENRKGDESDVNK